MAENHATTKWTWWRMASLSTTRVGCMHVRTCLSECSSATIWLKRELFTRVNSFVE